MDIGRDKGFGMDLDIGMEGSHTEKQGKHSTVVEVNIGI